MSWDWYQQTVSEGVKALGDSAPCVDYLDAWPTHPGYIAALAERVREATHTAFIGMLADLVSGRLAKTVVA